jgi:hypothetical protein
MGCSLVGGKKWRVRLRGIERKGGYREEERVEKRVEGNQKRAEYTGMKRHAVQQQEHAVHNYPLAAEPPTLLSLAPSRTHARTHICDVLSSTSTTLHWVIQPDCRIIRK